MRILLFVLLTVVSSMASIEIIETPNAVSAEWNGETLWTYHHDPAEGKPYFHPLVSTDGTVFTDLRPKDHPWHRAVWFSWKFINGVNYWEENRETRQSQGATIITKVVRKVADNNEVQFRLAIDYSPSWNDEIVLKELRSLSVLPPDTDGTYRIQWSSTFTAQDHDVELNRTPLPHEEGGKPYGGYAGYSVRMTGEMTKGAFISSAGLRGNATHHQPAEWILFNAPEKGGILFMDHPSNPNQPTKWYTSPGMGYFSPSVIHDGPMVIKAGESLTLKYSLVVFPGKADAAMAAAEWNRWTKTKAVILTGANNHNWKKTTPVLEAVLEESGRFDVDVVTDPEKLTPAFLADYDVLLSNWNAFGKNKPASWSEELKKAYVDFVRNGGGHVAVHAGSSSFYDWEDYQKICLATWKGGTGHKKPHEFEVRIAKPDHPAVRGLENFTTTDELWFKPFVQPGVTVLAESFSQYTGNWEPAALAGEFGKGRCFTLLLGHDDWFINNSDGFKKLLVRGTAWTAGE
ncbi:hypothetical protein EGM51_15950 [Verrucomicrobia bacterium S94]|nr:hypothetical protein EGM51_15950 [Verrucomicrobia bacterium S94]